MVERVLISDSGLRISHPGVSVMTAGLGELRFRAEDRSAPVILKATAAVTPVLGVTTMIAYGATLADIPPSILYWSAASPTASGVAYQLGAFCASPAEYIPQFSVAYTGGGFADFGNVYIKRFADRIEILTFHDSTAAPAALGGYVTAIVYDLI